MSQNPFVPRKPARITLDTLPELFAHNRARFGGWTMTSTPPEPDPPQPPAPALERPSDIAEDEWTALGDPGKRAIVRERARAEAAERALAASRARPGQPKPPKADDKLQPPPTNADDIDVEAIVTRAVQAAVKPFQEAEERRQTEEAANKVRDAVLEAARRRLHDATDALTGIDLASVVDDNGKADSDKLKTALDDLIARKPHLAKASTRQAPPGIGGGAPAAVTDAEKVKAVLADMQRATGVRLPQPSNS